MPTPALKTGVRIAARMPFVPVAATTPTWPCSQSARGCTNITAMSSPPCRDVGPTNAPLRTSIGAVSPSTVVHAPFWSWLP